MENLNLDINKNNILNATKDQQINAAKNLQAKSKYSEKDKIDLEKVARGFESIFMNMMFKEMRSAQLEDENGDGGFGSDTLLEYSNLMLTDQISNTGTGIGIAEKVYESMTGEKLPTKTVITPSEIFQQPISKIIPNEIKLPTPDTKIVENGNFLERVGKRIDNYQQVITEASDKYNIPEELIKAVITAESAGKHNARSPVGAKGLMQLMDGTARDLGVSNSFDPRQNIMGGTKYLRQMLDRFEGNLTHAIAAYNAGPGNVTKHNGIPPFKETQNYVVKVKKYIQQFRNEKI